MKKTPAVVISARTLVAELDSLEQARIYSAAPAPSAADEQVMAMVRTAALLNESLVVTDSMLLDGIFFLAVGPHALAAGLGVAPYALPLTVLTVSESLSDALQAKRENDRFLWQSSTYAGLREGNEPWPYRRVREAWTAWIEVAESGCLRVEKAGAIGATAGAAFVARIDANPDQVSGLGVPARELVEASRAMVLRSDFVRRHDELSALHPHAADEFKLVQQWWNDAYLDALAEANAANWIRFSASPDRSAAPPAGPPGRQQLRLSGSMFETMREVPPPVYGHLRHALRAEVRAFAVKPSRRTLEAIAYGTTTQLSHANRRSVAQSSLIRVGLALVALFVALYPLPQRWAGFDIAWLAVALVVVVTIPWGELKTLYETSHRNLAGVISVSGENT